MQNFVVHKKYISVHSEDRDISKWPHASLFSCCELTGLLYFYFQEHKILKDHYIVVYFNFNSQFYALSVIYGLLFETNPFCK